MECVFLAEETLTVHAIRIPVDEYAFVLAEALTKVRSDYEPAEQYAD
jgi:hypothetical protein